MKNNVFIIVGTILLIIFCACNKRSATVIESTQSNESIECQIIGSVLLDYYRIIDNFYKYRNEDSLFVGTSHHPQCLVCMDSLLIFNFDKGTIQKVEKPRYDRNSGGEYINYIKGFPTTHKITGDFNGNGKIDTVIGEDLDWETIRENDLGNSIDGFSLVFSDKTIPKLKVFGNIFYTIKNEGDLDGDGRDEIGFMYGWGTSNCRSYNVYTLKNKKWKRLIEDVPLTYDMRAIGILPVEKDPEQEGVILVRSAIEYCCSEASFIIEKSLKVKK
jgi:hypothetical protein